MFSQSNERILQIQHNNVRRFLFQTTLGSGAAPGFPPFAPAEKRGDESRVLLPVFAISRGRDVDRVAALVGGVLEPTAGLSVVLAEALLTDALAARKVLLTETDLKVAGFLADEPVRAYPLSSSLFLEPSPREASVSDPPLVLASAEFSWSSTLVMCLLATSSLPALPFKFERPESTL